MADSLAHMEDIGIFIPEALTKDGVTKYVIQIIISQTEWTVHRRFKEFAEVIYLFEELKSRVCCIIL